MSDKTPRKQQLLTSLSRLEAVERRWVGSVLTSLILSTIIIALLTDHLDIGHLLDNQPTQIPATQFILLIILAAIILVANLTAFLEYFGFELHVSRQIVIRKRHTRMPRGEENELEEE